MRIATWNINGLRARIDFIRHWLRERKPDVIGLQELKMTDEQFPHDVFEEEGYRVATHGQKSWNGVAIVTRGECEVTQTGLEGQEDFGSRLITASLGDLSFTTVYCPNGKSVEHADYAKKLAWYDALAAHWKQAHPPESAAVLCGDFNIVPTALDTWDEAGHAGHIFHTDEERERLRAILDLGLVDLFRELHPDERAFSWWDYRGGAFHRKQGLRIDFLLGTASVRERTREVSIDREYRKKQEGLTASDHAPVIADLD